MIYSIANFETTPVQPLNNQARYQQSMLGGLALSDHRLDLDIASAAEAGESTPDLIHPESINRIFQEGLSMDNLLGNRHDVHSYMQDELLASKMIDMSMDDITGGYIAGRHWSEFTESFIGIIDKYLGMGTEAYECTTDGMTKSWNAKENQLCSGAGECLDLNGDGYIGDAPTGDSCDGRNLRLSKWLLEKASEAADEAAKLLGLDGEDDDEEDDESNKDDCFEKPWELDGMYLQGGSDHFSFGYSQATMQGPEFIDLNNTMSSVNSSTNNFVGNLF